MAYKQILGRGNSPKTGHGLPSALKQMVGDIEYTASWSKQQKKGPQTADTVKPYEKRYVKGGSNKADLITNSEGRVIMRSDSGIKTGRGYNGYGNFRSDMQGSSTTKNPTYSKEALRQGFVADSTNTMKSRERTVDFNNALRGKNSNPTDETKKSLVKLGYARYK